MALPATIGKSYSCVPFAAGLARVAAAGTAIQACHNFTDLAPRRAKWLSFRGLDANAGAIYLLVNVGNPPWTLPGGATTSGADTTNYLNVIQILQPGESWSPPSEISNQINVGQFWIDAANSGDGAIMTIYEY